MPGESEVVQPTPEDLNALNVGYSDEPQHQATETPPVVEDKPAPQEVAPEPETVQLKKDEYQKLLSAAAEVDNLKASQQRMMDTFNGRLGRLQEEFKSTGIQEVTVDDFPELKSEFPELAAMQVKGINKILSKRGGGSAAEMQALVQQTHAAMREELINSTLDSILPDWDQELKKPEFLDWRNKQDEAVKALCASNSTRDAARVLRLYASRTKEQPKPAPAQTAQPAVSASPRAKRLEAAVAPKATSGNASQKKTDLDELQSGYYG